MRRPISRARRPGRPANPPPETHEEYGEAALERAEVYSQELRRLCAEVESFRDPRTGSVFVDNTEAAVQCADVAMLMHAEAIRAYWNLVDSGNEVGMRRAEDLAAFAHEKLLEVLALDADRGPGISSRVANTHDPDLTQGRFHAIYLELQEMLDGFRSFLAGSPLSIQVRDVAEANRLAGMLQCELQYLELSGNEMRKSERLVESTLESVARHTREVAENCEKRRHPNPDEVERAISRRLVHEDRIDALTRSGRES